MNKLVNVKKENYIALIGMNRPEKRNSLSPEMVDELLQALREADKDNDIRVIILYGEGKTFSAGGDIETLSSLSSTADLLDYMKATSEITTALKNMEKFVISAVHGFAAGAGFSIALASDFIIADKDSKFIASFTNVGLIPDLGLMKSLIERVSPTVAKEWIVSGKPIKAEELFTKGLINRISLEDLLNEASEFAQFIIESPPLANRFIKFMAGHMNEYSDSTSQMQENVMQALLLQTQDNKEGMNAFFEKRKPDYKGV